MLKTEKKKFYKTKDGKKGEIVQGQQSNGYVALKQKYGGIIYRKKDELTAL